MAGLSERDKQLKERDEFQREEDPNRQWHRPQEYTFSMPAAAPGSGESPAEGEEAIESDPITVETAAGFVYVNTNGLKQLDKTQAANLAGAIQTAYLAVT